MKKKILIAGGSGLIGSRLVTFLGSEDYHFHILSRKERPDQDGVTYYTWDPSAQTMQSEALDDVSAIINLAGAGIADKRWTDKRKKEILSSRVESIKTLGIALAKHEGKRPLYIGASAVGYYGNQDDKVMLEEDEAGTGFLAEVTKQWEEAHQAIFNYFQRNILLRIGIVLSSKGGALAEILKPAALGMYGYFGNGKAYYSWIHIDDICLLIQKGIEDDSYVGVYNATAPDPITIKTLLQSVKKAKGSAGLVLPVPEMALKIVLGEMTKMLTDSMRAVPKRLTDKGHVFLHTDPVEAIQDILAKDI